MSYIDPRDLLNWLARDASFYTNFSIWPFIQAVLEAAAPLQMADVPLSILVQVPLGFEFCHALADVQVVANRPQLLANVRTAVSENRLRLEARPPVPPRSDDDPGWIIDPNDPDAASRSIFGFVERYGALCIQHHPRLNCLAFQCC